MKKKEKKKKKNTVAFIHGTMERHASLYKNIGENEKMQNV